MKDFKEKTTQKTPPMQSTKVNGVELSHRDVVIHTTVTRFSFLERVRILFGKPLKIDSRIYTLNEKVFIVGSEAKDTIEHFHFPRFHKNRGYGECSVAVEAKKQ